MNSMMGVTGTRRTPFSQIENRTLANSVAETSIIGNGIGALIIPANTLKVGTNIYKTIRGFCSTGLVVPSMRYKGLIGGANPINLLLSGFAVSIVNRYIEIQEIMTVRTIGAAGTVLCSMNVTFNSTGATNTRVSQQIIGQNAIAINTTIANTIDSTITYGTADVLNNITTSQCIVEIG